MDETRMYLLRVSIAADQQGKTISKTTLDFWEKLRDFARDSYVSALDKKEE